MEESNDKHLAPWSQACQKDGIHATPLSPYLDQVLTEIEEGKPQAAQLLVLRNCLKRI